MAILALWWLWRYEGRGIVLLTATKMDQTGRMWNEVRQFWNRCPRLRAGLGQDARLLDRKLEVGPMRFTLSGSPPPCLWPAVMPRLPVLRGAHSPSGRVLVVVEEADGVAHGGSTNALEGSMSSDNAKMVIAIQPAAAGGGARLQRDAISTVGPDAHKRHGLAELSPGRWDANDSR